MYADEAWTLRVRRRDPLRINSADTTYVAWVTKVGTPCWRCGVSGRKVDFPLERGGVGGRQV